MGSIVSTIAMLAKAVLTVSAAPASPPPEFLQAGEAFSPDIVLVVDGDTLKVDGTNVRIANLDTPERGWRAECDAERFLATIATREAEKLVRGDKVIMIVPEGRADRYQRPLVRVTVEGDDWADLMISLNVAVPWAGRTHDWCGAIVDG